MIDKRRVELLAPAGNMEGFYGAIHAGADAVYLGGSRFGARAYAENFTSSQLVECIRYGHLFGRKIYLTVNTLIKEDELPELSEYLSPLYEAGLDAVIVQDVGALEWIKRRFPALRLHVSTQMTLCSHWGAGLLKGFGASRMIPARELSLQELSEIKSRVDIELETFIHGAMCYCYSGQCLFSSILGDRSGNRGRCAQPCRLPYTVGTDRRQSDVCYPLSLKDLCTIEHIPRLIEAGIDSFKIEGRMKKPEYAAGVTALYRKYIDMYYEMRKRLGVKEAAEGYKVLPEDLKALSSLYIRGGKQDGYYFRHNGREMVTLQSPAYSGNDEKLLSDIRARYLDSRLKLPVAVKASFVAGRPAKVTLQSGELCVTAKGLTVDRAQKQPVTEDNIRKQLGKMGDSAFFPAHMELDVGKDAFYPLRQINELRREAVCELERSLLERNGYPCRDCGRDAGFQTQEGSGESPTAPAEGVSFDKDTFGEAASGRGIPGKSLFRNDLAGEGLDAGIVLSVSTLEQLSGIAEYVDGQRAFQPKRFYIDGDMLLGQMPEILGLCQGLGDRSEWFIALPYILRQRDEGYLEALSEVMEKYPLFCGVLVRSMDGLAYAGKKGYRNRLDANVYCWNSKAWEVLRPMAEGFCLPLELKAGEQRRLFRKCKDAFGTGQFEKIVYGRIPMMVTANCLLKTAWGCQPGKGKQITLIDRYGKDFPVRTNCAHCMNIIYNSVPLSLHQDVGGWKGTADIRLDFTIESGDETVRVLEAFLKGGNPPYREYTTGHERRGVV